VTTEPEHPQEKINTTDLDSRLVKGMDGWLQGYNAQAATNEQQIVLAAEVMVSSPDFGHLEPMFAATGRELTAAGITEVPQVLLADAGYWHHKQMQRIMATGTQVLVPPDSSRRRGKSTRPGWDGGFAGCRCRGRAVRWRTARSRPRRWSGTGVRGPGRA
jgi:hypothetical protein